MTVTINGYTLSNDKFKITAMPISSKKEIDVEDMKNRHGSKTNKFSYYGGLDIKIAGICNLVPWDKNNIYGLINYGMVKLEVNGKFYICQNGRFTCPQTSNGSDWDEFEMHFIAPKPYVYNTTATGYTATLTASTPEVFYTNASVTMPYDDVNFSFNHTGTGTCSLILCGYKPVSLVNDTNGTSTMTVATASGFDYNKTSVGAIFPTATYVNRCYIYCESVTQDLIKKSDIKVLYKETAGSSWTALEYDFSMKVENGSFIARTGKFINIGDINKNCVALKVHYAGVRTTATFKFNSTATKYYDKMIIPKLYSKAVIVGSESSANFFFQNPSAGIITKNNKKDLTSTGGQLFRIFPHTTYYGVFATNPELVTKIKFNVFNIYEVANS